MEKTRPNVTQTLLGQEKSGAVGMISYSRWGWIRTSHLLQKAFFDSLFANPNQPAIDAMYDVKLEFAHYRDLVYGQNFFGDPTLKVYTNTPKQLDITHKIVENKIVIEVRSQNNFVEEVLVILSHDGNIIFQDFSNDTGVVIFDNIFSSTDEYTISVVKNGYTISQFNQTPSIITSIDDNENELPGDFRLYQNYPNPFNPGTTIKFEIPAKSYVKIEIFNVLGQLVDELIDADYPVGIFEIDWDGTNSSGVKITSGIYFYKIQTDFHSDLKKMVLLK